MSEKIIDKIRKCDMNKPYIFISYSSKDYDLVWQDVLEFQRRGYNVWLDEKNVDKTLDSWEDTALKAIRTSACTLLVFYVSRHSLISKACLNELNETKSDITKKRHGRKELRFLAVEAEPIGDLEQFADGVDDMIRSNTKISVSEQDDQMDTLSALLDIFGNNNARVRVKYKHDPSRIKGLDYYDEILPEYCAAAKVYDAVEPSAPSPAAAPATASAPVAEKPRREKSAPVYAKPSGTVDAAMGGASLAYIRERFSDAETVRAFRAVREDMPWGGKGAMDYLMASLLGGCNQVTKSSPVCQINYYLYAVASGEQKGDALGATWTWSSNCRKVLGLEKSGLIPDEINKCFAGLDGAVTLHDVAVRFQAAEEVPFRTLKNDLILHAAAKLDAFLNQ